MKAYVSAALVGLGACAAAVTAKPSDQQIEEMKSCAVCGVMAADEDLMKEMTWECHKIKDGMLCVATVPKEMDDEFDDIEKKMMEVVATLPAKIQQGEEVKLCHFCQGMGELTQAGAEQETVDTATGSICLITSDDAAVVEKIHAHADAAAAEEAAAK